jgi:hypothetical protein
MRRGIEGFGACHAVDLCKGEVSRGMCEVGLKSILNQDRRSLSSIEPFLVHLRCVIWRAVFSTVTERVILSRKDGLAHKHTSYMRGHVASFADCTEGSARTLCLGIKWT